MEPSWLQALAPAEWYERYGRRVENFRLPKTDAAQQELALVMGSDGLQLLQAIDSAVEQPLQQQFPAVPVLRQVLTEQFIEEDDQLRWREAKEMPASATMIASLYDPEARYSTKRETAWVGYKAHFTETCDVEMPQVVTNVETTLATTPDDNMIQVVHESLKARELLPAEHLVDKGYTDAQVLVDSQREYGVTIVGEVADDPSWQARSGEGYDKSAFHVDWGRQVVTCPAGKQSMSWLPNACQKYGVIFSELRCSCRHRGNP